MENVDFSKIMSIIKGVPYEMDKNKNYNDDYMIWSSLVGEKSIIVENQYFDKLSNMILTFLNASSIHDKALFSDNFKMSEFDKLIYANPKITEDEIFNHFNKIETINYQVIRPMINIVVEEERYYEFSPVVRFINPNYMSEYLGLDLENNNCKDTYLWLDKLSAEESNSYCYMQVQIKAKDITFAQQLAIIELNKIEHFLRFILHKCGIFNDFGVINYKNRNEEPIIIKNVSKIKCIGTTHSKSSAFVIRDRLFETDGECALHKIFISDSKNEIEKRLCTAIDWIGQSYFQVDPSVAFVQNCFAIEAILHVDDSYITKSITAQLSEYIAFILATDCDSRQKLASYFKKLYGIRSKIAHGTKSNDIENELYKLRELAIDLVLKFVADSNLCKLNSTEQLMKHIETLRYS
jgi:hypothetical protein